MKKIFLVDMENVHSRGLIGIDILTKDDTIKELNKIGVKAEVSEDYQGVYTTIRW